MSLAVVMAATQVESPVGTHLRLLKPHRNFLVACNFLNPRLHTVRNYCELPRFLEHVQIYEHQNTHVNSFRPISGQLVASLSVWEPLLRVLGHLMNYQELIYISQIFSYGCGHTYRKHVFATG